jgi:hypothetical protein
MPSFEDLIMKKVGYVQDIEKFWQIRREAKRNLEQKLANLPYEEKLAIQAKMEANQSELRRAKRLK